MPSKMLSLLLALLAACLPLRASPGEVTDLFLVLTAADEQTQLMALVLATEASRQQKQVQVLLCGTAGDMALRGDKEVILKPLNQSPRMLLKSLIEDAATVQVCPLYLPNKGLSAGDLIDGVTEAESPQLAEKLLQSGVRLLSF